MKSASNTLLRKIAPLYDAYIGKERAAFDSHAWAGIAFDLAAAADHYHGHMVDGYRPAPGLGSAGELRESLGNRDGNGMGAELRPIFQRTKGEVLGAACELAFRYYKAADGQSY